MKASLIPLGWREVRPTETLQGDDHYTSVYALRIHGYRPIDCWTPLKQLATAGINEVGKRLWQVRNHCQFVYIRRASKQ